jgi:hypothetical protein
MSISLAACDFRIPTPRSLSPAFLFAHALLVIHQANGCSCASDRLDANDLEYCVGSEINRFHGVGGQHAASAGHTDREGQCGAASSSANLMFGDLDLHPELPWHKGSKISVTPGLLKSLEPEEWVNDEALNLIMGLMQVHHIIFHLRSEGREGGGGYSPCSGIDCVVKVVCMR